MTNWISGCRLKKYHEPLTNEILQRLHASKERKRHAEHVKAQAQAEAKERAAKLRRARAGFQELEGQVKRLRICTIRENDSLTITKRPNIIVKIGTGIRYECALFDTGADVNSLSYESWEAIGKPTLTPSTTTLTSFAGETNGVAGFLELALFIGDTNLRHRFYVMKPGKVMTPVVLGQPWQRTYNGVPNWRREGITYEQGGIRYFTPFIEEACYTSDDDSDTESQFNTPTLQEDNKDACTSQQIQAPSLLKTTTQQAKEQPKPPRAVTMSRKPTTSNAIWVPKRLRQAQEGQNQIWIPKISTPQTTAVPQRTTKPQQAPSRHNSKNRKAKATSRTIQRKELANHKQTQPRWIPTTLLQAQGYYEGATQVWLPRIKKEVPKPSNKTAQVTPQQTTYKWVPKQKQTDLPPKQPTKQEQAPKQAPKRATAQEKGKWIPKKQTTPQAIQATTAKPSTAQEGQASRAQVTDKARKLAYLLMTLNQETLVKLWLQQRANKARTTNAASTTKATGPHMLQYPPLAQH